MNLVLIGATGFVGSALLEEALSRGHRVTAVARKADGLEGRAGVVPRALEVTDGALPDALTGADAVLSAFVARQGDDPAGDTLRGYDAILGAVKRTGVPRLLVVGGAGSLEVAPGQALVDQPGFPQAYAGEARTFGQLLARLRQEPSLDWTFLSPAAEIFPGARTGRFRLGGDQLLSDTEGCSRISVQDYAAAMLDELEQPSHSRRRFSVAY